MGITPEQKYWCTKVLAYLSSWDILSFFQKPIDPKVIGNDFPDYFEKVKMPMDLDTVRRKLNDSKYQNPEQFSLDLKLVFENARSYFDKENILYVVAEEALLYIKSMEKYMNMSPDQMWLEQLKEICEKIEAHMIKIPIEIAQNVPKEQLNFQIFQNEAQPE